MTAPLIAAATFAAGSRGERSQHDPVQVGFEEYSETPSVSRLLVARKVFEIATMDGEMPRDLVERYTGDIATAAVATASSTGLTKITSSLLFRAAKKHYAHETRERILAETVPYKQELDKRAADMKRSQRRALRHIVAGHDIGSRGIQFNGYSRSDGFKTHVYYEHPSWQAADTATEEDLAFEEFNIPRPKLFGATPEASAVAVAGLSHLYERVNSEVVLMQSAVEAVRELIPDFATDY